MAAKGDGETDNRLVDTIGEGARSGCSVASDSLRPPPSLSLSITTSQSPPKPIPFESVMPSNHLVLCLPLLLPPSIFPSTRVLSNESALCIRWPKDWWLSFSISLSSDYSGLISFGMDWLDLLAAQGALKSLPQHHSSKASILQHSAFLMVQLSHPYMTVGKTIGLTRRTFRGKEEEERVGQIGKVAWKRIHYHAQERQPVGIGCVMQGTQYSALWQPRGVEWDRRLWGVARREGTYVYRLWFTLMGGRNQYSIVKPLSSN